jgi:glycerol-1-phosphate dehydrogenase [NAD(P)+]
MICDLNTYDVAGEKAEKLFTEAGITVKKCVLKTREVIEPDEHAVGSVMMNYQDCDMIVSVGSGVINDVGKIVAAACNKTYMIIGTAPSMDGYASGTSSMVRGGHKVTITSKCPDIVVGDLDILCNAPMDMLRSGVGDMLAKYISICEWRIGRIVCGEYYCEKVASMVLEATEKCVKSATKLSSRSIESIKITVEGLLLSGLGIAYTGSSRPASGTEHVVRGGYYVDDAANLRSAARGKTNHDAWLNTDPQNPKSIWWYSDIKGIGFRVVCEVPEGVNAH